MLSLILGHVLSTRPYSVNLQCTFNVAVGLLFNRHLSTIRHDSLNYSADYACGTHINLKNFTKCYKFYKFVILTNKANEERRKINTHK